MEDIFKPEVKEYCSRLEALELLAFGWRPVDNEYLLDKPRRRFSEKLYLTENYNNLEAYNDHGRTVYELKKGYGYINEETLLYCQEMKKAWAKIKILIEEKRISTYENCNNKATPFFKTAEIEKYAPEDPETAGQAEAVNTTAGGYTTPYINLLHRIINKGYVSAEKQPLVKNLIPLIEEEAKAAGVNISVTMARNMATLLRLPEMAKGGLRK